MDIYARIESQFNFIDSIDGSNASKGQMSKPTFQIKSN